MTAHDHSGFADLLREAAAVARGDERKWERFVEALPEPVRRRMIEDFFEWQAHGAQVEPAGEWRNWLVRAGRGHGKTLAGAQWVIARVREAAQAGTTAQVGTVTSNGPLRIALVAETREEAVRVMVEGETGLLAAAGSEDEMVWLPTRGTVTFGSGAQAFVYSAAAPEALRGPQHHFAWCDELAKWKRADAAWDNLQMGLRLGTRPRCVVTTTPRPVAILRRVRADSATVETVGRMEDNLHSAEAFRSWARATYGGRRLGRQELDGMLFEDVEGALFPRDLLEAARVDGDSHFPSGGARMGMAARESDCPFRRIVVGVDPPASAEGDSCGIVVCGLGHDGIFYVLADCSAAGLRPEGWARKVALAATEWGADRVVAEKNQGGDMVESVLRAVDSGLPLRLVSASRGKVARAEPVAARFESGKAKLAGCFPELEDELAGLQAGGGYEGPGRSPDRADAMVWAMTELIRPERAPPSVRML